MLPYEAERAVALRVELNKRRKLATAKMLPSSMQQTTLLIIRSKKTADGGGVCNETVEGIVNATRRVCETSNSAFEVEERYVANTAELEAITATASEIKERCGVTAVAYCLYGSHWPEDICSCMPGYVHWTALTACMQRFEALGSRSVWPYSSSSLYEVIVSKRWMTHPVQSLPRTTVIRASYVAIHGVREAAMRAWAARPPPRSRTRCTTTSPRHARRLSRPSG